MIHKKELPHEYYDVLETAIGPLFLIFSRSFLVGISFVCPAEISLRHNNATAKVKKELAEYFRNERKEFSCSTAFLKGTEFEQRVWSVLKEVPYGETRSYSWLSARIGAPRATRAVGNALSKNPIPIIFPCHRIIESTGSLGGYTPGVDIKRRLLGIEYYAVR